MRMMTSRRAHVYYHEWMEEDRDEEDEEVEEERTMVKVRMRREDHSSSLWKLMTAMMI